MGEKGPSNFGGLLVEGLFDGIGQIFLFLLVLGVIGSGLGFWWGSSRGYTKGYKAALEEDLQKNCTVLENFYVCKDLRGFNEEAISAREALRSALDRVQLDLIPHIAKVNKGKDYTVELHFTEMRFGIRRDSKDPAILVVRPANKDNAQERVMASVPIADLLLKTRTAIKDRCLGEDNCDEKGVKIDALYMDAMILSQKVRDFIAKNAPQK